MTLLDTCFLALSVMVASLLLYYCGIVTSWK